MFAQLSSILQAQPSSSLPVLDSLLRDFPGMAYRCLNDNEWTMQYVSAGAEALTGYLPEALVGNRTLAFADIIHAEDRQRVQDEITRALLGQTQFAMSYRITAADGDVKWVSEHGNAIRDDEGRVVALQGFVMDVTAARQTQQALDEVTQRFKHIAQTTNDGVWEWDLRTNTSWWGDGIRTQFDLHTDEVEFGIGPWIDLIHPDDKHQVVSGLHDAIASECKGWSAEYRLRRKDGSYAEVIDRAFILRDESGTASRMVGGISDLTERKQSERHLAQLNRALRILSQCNERMVRAVNEQSLLTDICRVIVEAGGYRAAWVGFANENPLKSVELAASHGIGVEFLRRLEISWSADRESGHGPVGLAIRSGRPITCSDVGTDPRLLRWRKGLLQHGYRSGIWLPLAHGGRILGVIALYLGASSSFDDEEVQLLQSLANNLAFGIANMRSLESRKRIEQAAVKIAAGVSASTGVAFFEQLAHNMAQAVGANAAFVAQFHDGGLQTARTVTAIVDDRIVPNFEYAIAGSPCENIISSATCIVLDDVANCFPSSGAAKMGMRNYVGCRLDSAAGQPLGVLFVLFRELVPQPELAAQTIQIFAARAAAELERRLSDARICEQASLLDKAKDAIIVHDIASRVTFWNKGAERLYGLISEEVVRQPVDVLVYGDRKQYGRVTASLAKHGEWQGEIASRGQDGTERVVEINSTLVREATGQPRSVLSIITDVTRRKAAEREVTHLAFHDRVTGLPNRHSLMHHLEKLLGDGARNDTRGALLWIDLDRLKSLNDTRGHDMGDLLLRQVAVRLADSIGIGDIAARFGGDEFVVIMPDVENDPTRPSVVAGRLLQRLSESFDLDGHIHSGSASIGMTFFRCAQDKVGDILKRADIAMYEAKAAGRNTFRQFNAEMQQSIDARVQLENDLRRALQEDRLHLAYQPQLKESGEVIGVEALLRWDHAVHGSVSPAEFIPLAEASGLIIPLGQWVLEQACVQLKSWEDDPALQALSISVNVSAKQIHDASFVDQVLAILLHTQVDPRKLKLELTESALVTDAEATVAMMAALKEVGIQLSLDDFGTGYSSLSYLKRLPLDQLKIDRSFVADVMTDPNAAAITRTVIALGQSLGLQVIAEGVETEAQRQFLGAHGCNIYQGYFFSRPLKKDELENYLMHLQK